MKTFRIVATVEIHPSVGQPVIGVHFTMPCSCMPAAAVTRHVYANRPNDDGHGSHYTLTTLVQACLEQAVDGGHFWIARHIEAMNAAQEAMCSTFDTLLHPWAAGDDTTKELELWSVEIPDRSRTVLPPLPTDDQPRMH